MRSLFLENDDSKIQSVLFLGAHCDDIEIGCGGTVLRLAEEFPNVHIHWIIFSTNSVRKQEAEKSASQFLRAFNKSNILINDFRNGYFPYIGAEIKDYFEQVKQDVSPDIIFTHYRHDLHQDHRTLSDLTWNTFRDHLILEYEIPKYDGDIGPPNFFVSLSKEQLETKNRYILQSYQSQEQRQWFSEDTFSALARLRGVESNSESGFAEAFYCRKIQI
jgi:LmbE family N-acetylglucosaminyl deacetylase